MHAHPTSIHARYNEFVPLIDEEFDAFDTGQSLNDEVGGAASATKPNEYAWDDYSSTAD